MKFPMYLADIEAITGVPLTDKLKTEYQFHQVDPTKRARKTNKRAEGRQLSYVDEWLHLKKCMGMTMRQASTSAWEALTYPVKKDLTKARCDAFVTCFSRMRSKLYPITDQRAYDKLTMILPMKTFTALPREKSRVAPDQSSFRLLRLDVSMTVDKFTAPITKRGLSAPRRLTREDTTTVVSLNKADARAFIEKLQGP